MLSYEELKNKPRALLAATSLKQDEFEALLVSFGKAYGEAYPDHQTVSGQRRQRGKGGGNKGKSRRLEDKLLIIREYEKTYPLQTLLRIHFGMSHGRANEWLHQLLPILQKALSE